MNQFIEKKNKTRPNWNPGNKVKRKGNYSGVRGEGSRRIESIVKHEIEVTAWVGLSKAEQARRRT